MLVAFFFLFSMPIFFITILVSILLTDRLISPLVHLEDATRRVAEGDFSFRILTRPRDEFAALVDSFNSMVSELERSRRKLLQAERITAWQEIAQRLAHEIRNPLTPIKLSAQRILKKHSETQAPDAEGPAAMEFGRVLFSSTAAIIREVEGLEKLLRRVQRVRKAARPAARAGQPARAPAGGGLHLQPHERDRAHRPGRGARAPSPWPPTRARSARSSPTSSRTRSRPCPPAGVLGVRADTVRKAKPPGTASP